MITSNALYIINKLIVPIQIKYNKYKIFFLYL